MHLEGRTLQEIGKALGGVTRERARQMVLDAKKQLAFRVFRGLQRPLPRRPR
jgi:DNA-directed RNA polymerase sigma subunit (sigma70/sigma32)